MLAKNIFVKCRKRNNNNKKYKKNYQKPNQEKLALPSDYGLELCSLDSEEIKIANTLLKH